MAVACGPSDGGGSDASTASPAIHLVHPNGAPSVVEVAGLPASDLASLEDVQDSAIWQDNASSQGNAAWQAILTVAVAPGQPAVIGRYTVVDGSLRFTPQFPLDPGRTYAVRFDPSKLPASSKRTDPWRAQVVTTDVAMPSGAAPMAAHVRRVSPTGDEWPANLLRVYIEFSNPMSTRGGAEHLHILDEHGKEVMEPFLPLDYPFWNSDRTRFTAFMDPGRVKSGLVPRNEMGPALEPGKRYTLVVDAAWHDTYGQPLKEAFRREFRAVAPDLTPIDMAKWKVTLPRSGTTESVTVEFGESLDRQLMLRALAIRAPSGQIVPGDAHAEKDERGWSFDPEDPWPAGRYDLVALSILEDLAGNQIGRPFEVDTFTKVENPEPTTVARVIVIR